MVGQTGQLNGRGADLLQEKCGVFGVYGQDFEAARLVYPGLFSLQHRGQESTGIAASDGKKIRLHRGLGLVAHAYQEADLVFLKGHLAIGHNRYSTSGGFALSHAQPVMREDSTIGLAHNGNLPSTKALEKFLARHHVPTDESNDSEMMLDALRVLMTRGATLDEAIRDVYPLFTGAFSLLIMTRNAIAAVRDAHGLRPLSIGRLNGGYLFSSETCALDTVGAKVVRDVNPGELVIVDERGLHSVQLTRAHQHLDVFEFVYFARPDSLLLGKRVNEVRRTLGMHLAKESPRAADVVIPVPDSAIPAAEGYAEVSGIPVRTGLVKNRYIHRTFIQPEQHLREKHVEMKLNPLPEAVAGKNVIVVDDSIVRGTTSRKLVAMIRRAGAKRVHLAISSPPIRYPDFYGIDTPQQQDLIASTMSIKKITTYIGADSLQYLSFDGMIAATGLPEGVFSTSCFTGDYPIDIHERASDIVRVPAG